MFVLWQEPADTQETETATCDRVAIPELSMEDLFEDAFTAIARDGAATVEVMVRLLKAHETLAALGHRPMTATALQHAKMAVARAEHSVTLPQDIEAIRKAAHFAIQS